jgi:hypothetical protein
MAEDLMKLWVNFSLSEEESVEVENTGYRFNRSSDMRPTVFGWKINCRSGCEQGNHKIHTYSWMESYGIYIVQDVGGKFVHGGVRTFLGQNEGLGREAMGLKEACSQWRNLMGSHYQLKLHSKKHCCGYIFSTYPWHV